MLRFLSDFSKDDKGAVTVDFVVITAAITILGAAVGLTIATGAKYAGDKSADALSNYSF